MIAALTMVLSLLIIESEASGAETKQNEYVHVEVALSKQIVMPGDKIDLRVIFTPAEGIHVTADPAVTISVSPSALVQLRGKHTQTVDSSSGYLSAGAPVIQPIRISSSASPGKHLLNAGIIYYFCSDEAGWCRKFVQTVKLELILESRRTKPSKEAK